MHKFNAKLFVILALLTAIVAFVVFINLGRAYKTELDILILPRNEKTAMSLNQTVESIKQIPLSLSFYNKILEANKDIEDGANGLPDYKRKAYWNDKISAERIGQSGVIKFEVSDKNQWQSEILAYQLKNDIFTVISKYYNIKSDLEPRLIDGPITKNAITSGFWIILAKSVGIGLALGFVVAIIIAFMSGIASMRKEKLFNGFDLKNDILPEKDLSAVDNRDFAYAFPAKKSAAEEALEEIREEELKAEQENNSEENAEICVDPACASEEEKKEESEVAKPSTDRKSGAPGNLPFTEEELPDIFGGNGNSVKNSEVAQADEENIVSSYKEATPEEVKARLMKLLNGKK